jgi:hypothetical protein
MVLLWVLLGCTPSESVYTPFAAKVWIDANENGVWDDHEQPLAGVRFPHLDRQGGWVVGISNDRGEATASGWAWRAGGGINVCVDPVPGYRLTTSACSGSTQAAGSSAGIPALFGFAPLREEETRLVDWLRSIAVEDIEHTLEKVDCATGESDCTQLARRRVLFSVENAGDQPHWIELLFTLRENMAPGWDKTIAFHVEETWLGDVPPGEHRYAFEPQGGVGHIARADAGITLISIAIVLESVDGVRVSLGVGQ